MGGEKKRGGRQKYAFMNLLDKVSFGKIFFFWIVMTLNFGLAYFLLTLTPENALTYHGQTLNPDMVGIENSVYYSFITVTTTGYGDVSPQGISKLLAVLEVLFGVIIQGLVVSKLVSFKQEAILEEIYNINYEEAFTNYRRSLSLFRTDLVGFMEKVETGSAKQRDIKDLWITFSSLDQTLTNIKGLAIPTKESIYNKKLDTPKLELILNSLKLSIHKITELLRVMKKHNVSWREELLLTSLHYDIQTCRELLEYEFKKTSDTKVIDKLKTLKAIIEELESEIKTPDQIAYQNEQKQQAPPPPADEPHREDITVPEPKIGRHVDDLDSGAQKQLEEYDAQESQGQEAHENDSAEPQENEKAQVKDPRLESMDWTNYEHGEQPDANDGERKDWL